MRANEAVTADVYPPGGLESRGLASEGEIVDRSAYGSISADTRAFSSSWRPAPPTRRGTRPRSVTYSGGWDAPRSQSTSHGCENRPEASEPDDRAGRRQHHGCSRVIRSRRDKADQWADVSVRHRAGSAADSATRHAASPASSNAAHRPGCSTGARSIRNSPRGSRSGRTFTIAYSP